MRINGSGISFGTADSAIYDKVYIPSHPIILPPKVSGTYCMISHQFTIR